MVDLLVHNLKLDHLTAGALRVIGVFHYNRQLLRLIGIWAGSDSTCSASYGHRTASAIIARTDAVSTDTLRSSHAGHGIFNGDGTARGTMISTADTRGSCTTIGSDCAATDGNGAARGVIITTADTRTTRTSRGSNSTARDGDGAAGRTRANTDTHTI